MISQLQSPSVCVVDDEREDYEPLLKALLRLGLGCVHVKGDSIASLPKRPFNGLRVVFMDLHLAGVVGKDAASHASNVFSKVVAKATAPLLVVIWSKYRNDVPEDGDELTESALFQKTLLDNFPHFSERLVFLEMAKPKLKNRPAESKWVTKLRTDVENTVAKVPAFGALWAWEGLVRQATDSVAIGLTETATLPEPTNQGDVVAESSLADKLKLAMRILVHEQGGADCTIQSAPTHLATVLGQALIDCLESLSAKKALAQSGEWLADHTGLPKKISAVGPSVNAFLLTCPCSEKAQPFAPGNIYRLADKRKFEHLFGITADDFQRSCSEAQQDVAYNTWKDAFPAMPVLVELSPACDVHQGHRKNSLLVGGFIFSAGALKRFKRANSLEILPTFMLRWPTAGFATQPAFLAFSSRLKVTIRAKSHPVWLRPWFRVRELPTASLRNWYAAHSARVGYVSVR